MAVTGVETVAAGMMLATSLAQADREFTLGLGLDDLSRCGNLIIVGGPSANHEGRRLYERRLQGRDLVEYDESGRWSMGNTTITEAEEGLVVWCKNPDEPDKRILWVSGLGAHGTTGAMHYALTKFTGDETPARIARADEFAIFTRGVLGGSDMIEDADYVQGTTF